MYILFCALVIDEYWFIFFVKNTIVTSVVIDKATVMTGFWVFVGYWVLW